MFLDYLVLPASPCRLKRAWLSGRQSVLMRLKLSSISFSRSSMTDWLDSFLYPNSSIMSIIANQYSSHPKLQIQSKFRLETFLSDFISIWQQFNTSVINPVVNQVETASPSVDSYTALASTLISVAVYVTFVICLLVLVAQITCLAFCLADIIDRRMYLSSGESRSEYTLAHESVWIKSALFYHL